MNGPHGAFFEPVNDVWVFEYLDLVEELCGPDTAKTCLLDVLRLLKLQDLELIHTCRKDSLYQDVEEEIEEIHSDQRGFIEILGKEMQDIESSLSDDPEGHLLAAFSHMLVKAKRASKEKSSRTKARLTETRYRMDERKDQFVCEMVMGDFSWTRTKDPIGLNYYVDWVEHEHLNNQKQAKPDDEWYDKRTTWISRFRSMEEEAQRLSEEPEIPAQPILLRDSIY